MKPIRIAVYSHDAMGLGHMRRNLLIAETLQRSVPAAEILLLAGAPELGAFPIPSGISTLTLPPLHKNEDGSYVTRGKTDRVDDMLALRGQVLLSAFRSYTPDLAIVDKHPRGLLRELDPSLRFLRLGGSTRMVLGLRDVLDAPQAVAREWKRDASAAAMRDDYHAIWVYGDPRVFDARREYAFPPELEAKTRFTGYLDPSRREAGNGFALRDLLDSLGPQPLALCVVGGGQDGAPLAEAFVAAGLPEGMHGIVLTGPYMPPELRRRLLARAAGDSRIRILEFLGDPLPLVRRADRIVAMGGYNTLCEALAEKKPLLVAPRSSPRSEQLIRTRRFAELGLLRLLEPEAAVAPAIRAWLEAPAPEAPPLEERVDFRGLARIPRLVEALLADRSSESGRRHTEGGLG